MSSLKQTVTALSIEFAEAILSAVRDASVIEIASSTSSDIGGGAGGSDGRRSRIGGAYVRKLAISSTYGLAGAGAGTGGGKRVRRSMESILEVAEEIAAFVRKHKHGAGAEEIRAALDITKKDFSRPLEEALSKRLITKKGERRATKYYVGSKTSIAASGAKMKTKTKYKAKAKLNGAALAVAG